MSAFQVVVLLVLAVCTSLRAESLNRNRGVYAARSLSPAPAVVQSPRVFKVTDPTAAARLRVGPTMGLLEAVPGYGGTAEITFSTGAPFFIGVESGYVQWDLPRVNEEDGSETKERVALVPILATFLYRFPVERSVVRPYLGVALGASLTTVNNGTDQVTTLGFAAFAKPGVEFELSKVTSLFLEPRFGSYQSKFHFMPQVGLAFAL